MATGTAWNPGGVASPSDVAYAGASEWERMTGASPVSPLVGGAGLGRADMPYNVDGSRTRIVTTGAGGPGVAAGSPGVHTLDTWRDAFNPASPAFWILLLLLVMVGLMQLRVSARAGKAKGSLAIG